MMFIPPDNGTPSNAQTFGLCSLLLVWVRGGVFREVGNGNHLRVRLTGSRIELVRNHAEMEARRSY